jgi:hypothetical protein
MMQVTITNQMDHTLYIKQKGCGEGRAKLYYYYYYYYYYELNGVFRLTMNNII